MKQRNALRAGIFIVLSIIAAIAITLGIAGSGRITQHYTSRSVAFNLKDDIGGLRKGDDVRIGGLRVGSVDNIAIESVQRDKIPTDLAAKLPPELAKRDHVDIVVVTFSIPAKYDMRKDASVAIETTVTGVAAVNIDDLGTGVAMADGDVLPGNPDSLTSLLHKAGPQLTRDLQKIETAVDTYTQVGRKALDVEDDVREVIFDTRLRLRDTTASAVRALDSIHDLVGPSTSDFHGTIADIHEITSAVRRDLPGLLSTADSAVHRADASLLDVKVTAANLKEISTQARSVIARNQSRIDGIIIGLKKTSDNLEGTSVEIRHSPWRLLYKPTEAEMKNLNLYDSARQFAEGAGDVSDAASALKDALKDQQTSPEKLQLLYDDLAHSMDQFKTAEDSFWTKVKE
jgi:ABC-type transporter Mla subunit MlaD